MHPGKVSYFPEPMFQCKSPRNSLSSRGLLACIAAVTDISSFELCICSGRRCLPTRSKWYFERRCSSAANVRVLCFFRWSVAYSLPVDEVQGSAAKRELRLADHGQRERAKITTSSSSKFISSLLRSATKVQSCACHTGQ